jgi:putative endonuclease
MYFRQEIGKLGENLACKYLEENNYQVIDRNFLCRQGEIDIIAKDITKKELVFVEVKTRSNFKYGNPADSVNTNKQKHMKQAIKYYIYKNSIKNIPIRIDVIEIYIVQNYKINHIKQIL